MINVSTEYFESINAPMRLPMYFVVGVGVANTEMANNSVYSDNGHTRYSSVNGLKNLYASNKVYTTAEPNMYLLDGEHEITPSTDNFQGYVSSSVSKEDCTFDNPPAITIQSDGSYDLIGFTIQFDMENNDYATEFNIAYYNAQNSLIRRQSVYGNEETKYIDDTGTNGVNKIIITFTKTHNYNRRIRITGITLGVYEEFYSGGMGRENTIKTLSHDINISPLMKEIPANDFSFTIDDTLANYNPENPKGIWKYTKKGQIVTLKYIQTLNDGGRESVVGGRFYLESKPEAENMDAKFKAVSRIESLEQTYDEGQYYVDGRSYKSLFDDVFTFCGLGQDEYELDSDLANKKTMIPLPVKPAKECIQLLCQACGKIAYEDTSGRIWIKNNNTTIDTYALNVAQDYSFPKYTEETPEVRNVIIKKRSLAVKNSVEELAKSSFTITGTQEITIDYDLSTNHTYTISGGTVVSGTFYGRRCKLEVSVSGTQEVEIVVSGNRIEETSTNIIYNVNTDGFDCELDFSMLSENSVADELFTMYRKYLLENKRYEISYRGNPELRPQDIMQIQTRFTEEINTMILKSSFNWNNGASGSLTLKNYSN